MSRVLLFISAFLVLVVLLVLLLLPKNQTFTPTPPVQVYSPGPVQSPSPQATVTPAPPSSNPIPTPVPTSQVLTREQLIGLMPVQTKEFNIEYFSKPDSFTVTIKESPYQQNRTKSEDWFRERGFSDFNSLRVYWTSYPYVQ